MFDGGCDFLYIVWWVVCMVSEEVGNVDFCVFGLCLLVWDVQECLGSFEGELVVVQVIVYLVCVLKSNVVYSVFNVVMCDVVESGLWEVLLYLCNVLIKLMKSFGYGEEYCYVYDELDVYVVGEDYFFEDLELWCYY